MSLRRGFLSLVAGPFLSLWVSGGVLAQACSQPIEPLVSLQGVGSFYRADPTQSIVDPQMAADFHRLTRQYDALLDRLLAWSQENERPGRRVLDCAMEQLEVWAGAGALTQGIAGEPGVERRQAAMIQTWVLTASSALLLSLDRDDLVADRRFPAVAEWMSGLAHSVRREFEPRSNRPDWLNRTSNHSHWAGLAMLRVGLLTQDRLLVAAGLSERDAAIRSIADDGSLPAELGRGGRALAYTNFALLPMLGLADTASRYGWPLGGAQAARLQLAVDFGLAANRNPDLIAERVGSSQVGYEAPGSLGWVPLAARLQGQSAESLFPGIEPVQVENKYLGVTR